MPPVIYDTQDIVGNGRYKQYVRFPTFPGGIKYKLALIEISTGKRILLYDVHRGKPHHRHLRDKETTYNFVNEITLLSDFLRDVDLILDGKL